MNPFRLYSWNQTAIPILFLQHHLKTKYSFWKYLLCKEFSSNRPITIPRDVKIYKWQGFCSDHSSNFQLQTPWEDKNESPQLTLGASDLSAKAISDKQVNFLTSNLEAMNSRVDQLKPEDWDKLKNSVLEMNSTINEKNIDAVIMNKCCEITSLLLGKSYFQYMKFRSKQINRATYGNYLRLFFVCSTDCTDFDLNEINVVYRELLHVFPVLDAYTIEKAVCALSLTKYWKEYEKLFRDIKIFYNPTTYVYSAVIKAAFKNKEFDLGWDLVEEMHFQGQTAPDDVFIFWLQKVKDKQKDDDLKKVLNFLYNFNIKPSLDLCKVIKNTFEQISSFRTGTFTTVTRRGMCKNCQANLEPSWVSQEDYDHLKTTFLNPVLIGKDIFQKTQPEEFNEFLKYLEKTAPYDVVLDGLNIALKAHKKMKGPKTFSFQLKSVVKHFADRNQKVLVLGRHHMRNWPAKEMQFIYNHACTFFTEDLSQDDPFLLYATLFSGLGTRFVSKDLMRGHKFLLADAKAQATFQKWQAHHQYFFLHVEDNGTAHFQEPIPFMQSIQQNLGGDWHIPYFVRQNFTNMDRIDNFHKQWLCLLQQGPRQPLPHPEGQAESSRYHQNKRKVRISSLF